MKEGTFTWWMTREEYAHDRRTGATAMITEGVDGWKWRVVHNTGRIDGTSTTQKGARAACRRAVRKLKGTP